MTTLDARAGALRARANHVELPSLATILVTLISIIPFVLAWTVNAVKQLVTLLIAAWVQGWQTAERQMGPPPRGGS